MTTNTLDKTTRYNLVPGSRLLKPIITPLRNVIPRDSLAWDQDGPMPLTVPHEMLAGRSFLELIFTHFDLPSNKLSLRNVLTREQAREFQAQGEMDAAALMTANTLRALMIGEEESILLGAPTNRTYAVGGRYFLPEGGTVPLGGERTPQVMHGIFSQLAMEDSGVARGIATDATWARGLYRLAEDIALRHRALSFTAYLNAEQAARISRERPCGYCGHSPDEYAENPQPSPGRRFTGADGDIAPITLVTHPLMPEGHALLVPNELPSHYLKFMRDLGWNNPRAPWSMGLYADYTQLAELTDSGDAHIEIFIKGALRVHTPGLFGWLQAETPETAS